MCIRFNIFIYCIQVKVCETKRSGLGLQLAAPINQLPRNLQKAAKKDRILSQFRYSSLKPCNQHAIFTVVTAGSAEWPARSDFVKVRPS